MHDSKFIIVLTENNNQTICLGDDEDTTPVSFEEAQQLLKHMKRTWPDEDYAIYSISKVLDQP